MRAALGRSSLFTGALLLALAAPARGQQYGQWTWDAALRGSARGYRNFLDAEKLSTLDERDLTLSLGVNGFIFHPALARFRASVDTTLSSSESTRSFGSHRWGFGASLNVLPFGPRPLSLYANRQLYTYSGLGELDSLTLLSVPDTTTSFGGRLRTRTGRLRGILLGFDRTSIRYQDRDTGAGAHETAFLDWSQVGSRFRRHLRAERRSDDYAAVGYRVRDLNGTYDQNGPVGAWRWEMSAVGIHRGLDYQRTSSSYDNLRTNQSFIRPVRARDLVDLRYDGGLTGGGGATFQSHALRASYRWRPGEAWTVSPFVGYGLQLQDNANVQAPQLGAYVTWAARRGGVDLTLTNGLGYSRLSSSGGASRLRDSSTFSFDLGVSAGHGDDTRLRKELDLSWAHNRLRMAGESLDNLPDLGNSLSGLGTEDRLRGRITLRRRWRQIAFYAYGEGERRDPSGSLERQGPGVTHSMATFQMTGPRASLTWNLVDSHVHGTPLQSFHAQAAAGTFRLLGRASLTASYRTDTRHLVLTPDVDGERLEVGADLGVGAFVITGRVFWGSERSVSRERRNNGFNVSFSRPLVGWLPFVTGQPRSGEIR